LKKFRKTPNEKNAEIIKPFLLKTKIISNIANSFSFMVLGDPMWE